jgi:hypothetical protein
VHTPVREYGHDNEKKGNSRKNKVDAAADAIRRDLFFV